MKAFDPVAYAVPIFILTIILEIVLGRLGKAKAEYEVKDTATSLFMGFGSSLAGLLTAGTAAALSLWAYEHRLFTIPMTAWWAWLAIILIEDMTYYWFHRIAHERRFWWASHVNHHTSQHYNLSTALRQTWTGGIAGTWLLWVPMAFLGFHPIMIGIQKGFSLVYQYWIHTEAIGKMPRWFEAVFNTPSHHRVHHARNPRYLDKNYAGILIIWDKMFGTFTPELAEEPCRYGIVKNLGTFNILRVAFHEWVAMAGDVVKHPRHALGYIFGPPGWSHDGSRETSQMIKARWRAANPGVGEGSDPTPAEPQGSRA